MVYFLNVDVHECGHVLDKIYEGSFDGTHLTDYEAAAIADGNSVSGYGNNNYGEDFAEYARAYGIALLEGDTKHFDGRTALEELERISPNQFKHFKMVAEARMIVRTPATVTLSDLSQTYDGSAKSVTVSTDPIGLAVDVTYAGSPTAPSNIGSYASRCNCK